MQRGVKLMIFAEIFPLHDAAEIQISPLRHVEEVKSSRCILQ
jgi:hypothetical protein